MKILNVNVFTAVDLYCGCGGVTEALKQSGFRVVAAVDNDPVCCLTYKANHPKVRLYKKDICKVKPVEIRNKYLQEKDLDLLVVCAPCQPFSSLNKKKEDDGRSLLILDAVRFARVLVPKVIFFENVPGLSSNKYHAILEELRFELKELDYVLSDPLMVDAADYGVPQRRKRCVLLATKNIEPPDLLPPTIHVNERRSVKQAIGDLAILEPGSVDQKDPLHAAHKLKEINVIRLAHIPVDGGSRDSLPPDLQLKCHKKHKGHPDVYGRMSWDAVAPTLTTGCTDITKGRFVHPIQNRAITLREAARLQTFPDSYKFKGSPQQIARQIGNAVPVELLKALSPSIKETIRRVYALNEIHSESN